MRHATILAIPLLAIACAQDDTASDVYAGDPIGKIAGFVTTIDGEPLADVTVTAQGLTATTDADGRYVLDGIAPEDQILVTYDKDGYARRYSVTRLQSWETATANARMLEIDGRATFDASTGGTIEVGEVKATFPPDVIVYDADGAPYEGTVVVEVTHVDPYSDEILGAPGDLRALRLDGASGTAKDVASGEQLVSYGMADITLEDESGERLNIEEGAYVDVEFTITNGDLPELYHLSPGDTQDTWSFDTKRMAWVDEGVGTVAENEDGELVFQFQAGHFSWWNCDQGYVPSCAVGRVVDVLGFPVRGAEVVCAGGQTTSIVTTDEDGYYVCDIMVGDSVTFTATTFVADRNWSKTEGAFFMDGEGSSAATCEPIPDIEIEVCREAGIVMSENVHVYTDQGVSQEADQLRAWFWEPPGTPEACDNPWLDIEMGTCETMLPSDAPSYFPEVGRDGIPSETRSVGSYLELDTGRRTYRIDRTYVDGRPVYVWDPHSLDTSDGVITPDDVSTDFADVQGGDTIGAVAPGDLADDFGPIDEPNLLVQPADLTLRSGDGPVAELQRGSSLSFTFDAAHDADGMLLFAVTGTDEPALMCRYEDDGSITLGGSDTANLQAGENAGLTLFRPELAWAAGPDGLPIRIQAVSGAAIPINTVK